MAAWIATFFLGVWVAVPLTAMVLGHEAPPMWTAVLYAIPGAVAIVIATEDQP